MDKDKRSERGGVIKPFVKPARRQAPEERDGSKSNSPRRIGHPIRAYIDMLEEEGFISTSEHERLVAVFTPLVKAHPSLKRGAVQTVRSEMGRPENNKYTLRDKEETYWRAAGRKGIQPIPDFDLASALAHFKVTPERDPDQTVVFLRPEYEHNIAPYVPPSLRMGEVFFYVVLRMFRWHCQKDRR